MTTYTIIITDEDVYINGELHNFELDMDKTDKTDDMNMKAILALANVMGYEASGLFQDMTDRLEEMLDEI